MQANIMFFLAMSRLVFDSCRQRNLTYGDSRDRDRSSMVFRTSDKIFFRLPRQLHEVKAVGTRVFNDRRSC